MSKIHLGKLHQTSQDDRSNDSQQNNLDPVQVVMVTQILNSDYQFQTSVHTEMNNLVNTFNWVQLSLGRVKKGKEQDGGYYQKGKRIFSYESYHGTKITNVTITQCLKTISISAAMTG